jgi:hypothetical protein
MPSSIVEREAHLGNGATIDIGDEFGGDPACWLGRVCAECGALIEGSMSQPCWRCGMTPTDREADHD